MNTIHIQINFRCHFEMKTDQVGITEKSYILRNGKKINFRCLNLPISSELIDMTNQI